MLYAQKQIAIQLLRNFLKMTNTQTLKSWGFYEKDGWLCSPKLKEEFFHIADVEAKDMSDIIEVITSSSFNAGSRWQCEESKIQLVRELEGIIKNIKNG